MSCLTHDAPCWLCFGPKLWPSTQVFEAGARETGAIAVAPSAYTLSEYLASYTAQLPSGPTAYYINDRFLLSVPEELVESLVGLYANATSPHAVLLIQPGSRSVGVNNNSDTAFGYRDAWTVWVWPFWLRSDGGAAVDGELLSWSCRLCSDAACGTCCPCVYVCFCCKLLLFRRFNALKSCCPG